MAKRRKNTKLISAVVVVLLLLISTVVTSFISEDSLFSSVGLRDSAVNNGKMIVDFIDVGQGDCTLITTADAVILIDGGESGEAQQVINYIKNKNISKIDCCIATHPHSDHIGSLYKVFEEFDVVDLIMPEIPEKIIPTTSTYERFLESVSKNVKNVLPAVVGETHTYGSLSIDILGPVNDYDDLNDMSVVSRITFGDTSVMVTGDAGKASEEDMLGRNGVEYSADILKVGHHGSRTSSSDKWLQAVNPQYAVIMCGSNNDYGHPHKQLSNRLNKLNVNYYRTDLLGSIAFESDGSEVKILSEEIK